MEVKLRCTCCGCTDDHACAGGCSWLIRAPVAICSACAPGKPLQRALRFLAVFFETNRMIARAREAQLHQTRIDLDDERGRLKPDKGRNRRRTPRKEETQ